MSKGWTASISEAQIRDSIREILRNADLSALSSKTVRKTLEEKFHTDLTAIKQEIDDILMSLIDAIGDEKDAKKEPESESGSDNDSDDEETSNGKPSASAASSVSKNGSASLANSSSVKSKLKRSHSSSSGTNSDSDAVDTTENNMLNKAKTSAKKQRGSDAQVKGEASSSDEDVDDEAFARKLQQQELRMRPRSSKQKVEKKSKSTKSAPSEGRKKGNSLYSQECVLSQELAAVMGTDRLARKDVVSRMWKIFKERNLMDPKNKQFVICDEQLEKVFKCKKFKAFSMMKILKTHIKDAKLIQS